VTPARRLGPVDDYGDVVHPPFTTVQFFDVFRRYNEAVWPLQIALLAIGLIAAYSAYRADLRRSWRAAQLAIMLVAALWLWCGIAYHRVFFASLTPAGKIFALFFIAEALLLAAAARQNGAPFVRASRSSIVIGTLLVSYALVFYPAIGFALGQRYPAMPTFGVPCPTTIFTFGIFCLLPARVPRFAMVIPILWSLIASYAALGFGVGEDAGLIVAAVAAIIVVRRGAYRAHLAHVAV